MSTEYYLTIKPNLMETLHGKLPETLDIGLSAGGWCFSLCVYPDRGIMSLTDWYRLFRNRRNIITDEYGVTHTWQQMIDVIVNRSGKSYPNNAPDRGPYYKTEDFFLTRNHAEYGPNGCLRAKISTLTCCIGHGSGTWDLMDYN